MQYQVIKDRVIMASDRMAFIIDKISGTCMADHEDKKYMVKSRHRVQVQPVRDMLFLREY